MQFNTMVRLGSLAFNVAQDDNVRELFTMIHKGAKRRGMIGPIQQPTAPSPTSKPQTNTSHPVPFSPPAHHQAPALPPQWSNWGKYMSGGNAKKMLGWAGEISKFLID